MQQITTHFLTLLLLLSLSIQISALNDTAIDFSTVPFCARSNCLEDASSPYTWTPQSLCPSSPSASSILPSCFCSLPRPLLCLPYDPTVPNPCYTELTAWYAALCNSTVGMIPNNTLPYLKLPECARTCAIAMTSHLGCPDHSLNCACQLAYLPGNTAECVRDRCAKDIITYIGDLQTFTGKWVFQACGFDENGNTDNSTGIRSDTPEYKNSPAAHPQEILADDFQGEEYTNWQDALNAKRAKNSNLGVIIPLSLVFGGVFGVLGLQWLAACCGFTTPAGRRMWDRVGRLVTKVFGGVGTGLAWVGKGFVILGRWIVKGGKVVLGWVR
ncbi:uncharacterized protein DFL_004518 [Arthrobotrys flagrans]|uniref:CFEM domain-containing protein n=1 Tax=Arthrobotrys flagrans TaxID=97331 RepID=A0A437A4T7_ARTFL|nr:hypothetical protein DFL_004518 [Arthrobotrys flagrans]